MIGTVVRGALAGLAGTAIMTPVQLLGVRNVSAGHKRGWMPIHVFREVAQRSPLEPEPEPGEPAETTLATAAHFAYGAAFGTLYALWRRQGGGSLPSGVAFGLALWTLGYAGILPAAQIVPPPDEEGAAQTARLIAAHLVYGMTLGVVLRR